MKNIFEINKELIDREAEKQEKYSNDTMNLILFILTKSGDDNLKWRM